MLWPSHRIFQNAEAWVRLRSYLNYTIMKHRTLHLNRRKYMLSKLDNSLWLYWPDLNSLWQIRSELNFVSQFQGYHGTKDIRPPIRLSESKDNFIATKKKGHKWHRTVFEFKFTGNWRAPVPYRKNTDTDVGVKWNSPSLCLSLTHSHTHARAHRDQLTTLEFCNIC